MTQSLGLVVPLYNEVERLPEFGSLLVAFVENLPVGSELVFVDDGSDDGTDRLVQELVDGTGSERVRLLRRPHRGKGAAVTAGLRAARGDYRGFCDVDLSTPLDQLEVVLNVATRANLLAVGSRDLAASRLIRSEGRVRELLGRTYNRLLQFSLVSGVVDTQCGAKIAAGKVWDSILPHCSEDGYAWDAEIIAVALALRIPVQEVAIDWRHDERSKVHLVSDGIAMLRAVPRIRRTVRTLPRPRPATIAGGVFDDENAKLLSSADANHWWFRSKAAFVATALRRTGGPGSARGWLVDAGGGSGGVTARLGWRTERALLVEGSAALLHEAHGCRGLLGIRAHVDNIPVEDGSAEVVCLLDVIEHLDDPLPALREAARALEPGGRLVVNVPAHPWLWSAADEALGHARRYTRSMLRTELEAAGFEADLLTHVFSWLVLPVWLKRHVASSGDAELGVDQDSSALDTAAIILTRLERSVVGRLPLPFGTSVLCVARAVSDVPGSAVGEVLHGRADEYRGLRRKRQHAFQNRFDSWRGVGVKGDTEEVPVD